MDVGDFELLREIAASRGLVINRLDDGRIEVADINGASETIIITISELRDMLSSPNRAPGTSNS